MNLAIIEYRVYRVSSIHSMLTSSSMAFFVLDATRTWLVFGWIPNRPMYTSEMISFGYTACGALLGLRLLSACRVAFLLPQANKPLFLRLSWPHHQETSLRLVVHRSLTPRARKSSVVSTHRFTKRMHT